MDTILYKYRLHTQDYLIYDARSNAAELDPAVARYYFTSNFAVGTAGLLVAGPEESTQEDGSDMRFFDPEGQEKKVTAPLRRMARKYLADRRQGGYGQTAGTGTAQRGEDIACIGKAFFYTA